MIKIALCICIVFVLSGCIWWKEYHKYKNFYYVVNGEADQDVYDNNKELLYESVNIFSVQKNWNYIICNNEKRTKDGSPVDLKGEVMYDHVTADCTVYDSSHEKLWEDILDSEFPRWWQALVEITNKY